MEIFSGKQIALDLSYNVGFKKKTAIKRAVTENGGIISYIVTKKSSFVVVSDTEKIDISSKCRNAVKYGIPIVSLDFIWDCVDAGTLLKAEKYAVGGYSHTLDFKNGKITASTNLKKSKKKRSMINVAGIKNWKLGENGVPEFPEKTYEVLKYSVFKFIDKKTEIESISTVELHIQSSVDKDLFKYRVYSHLVKSKNNGNVSQETFCRFCNSSEEALQLYEYLFVGWKKKKYIHLLQEIPLNIGSPKAQKIIADKKSQQGIPSPHIADLVDHIWQEATGQLENVLSTPITDINLDQIDKADAILLELKKEFQKNEESNKLQDLLSEFYKTLPHKHETICDSPNRRWFSDKQDLCQLIRDMLSVTEATNWSTQSSSQAKFRALRCNINGLKSSRLENEFREQISLTMNSKMHIVNVYEVQRPIEESNFTHDLQPQQLLYHSSRVENFVGLLSRGLLLPKVVVDDHGGKRTDAGLLGSGIYFSDTFSKSARYSTTSSSVGTRLMLICEVALGRKYECFKPNEDLKEPPQGYNSVHGVKKNQDNNSDFLDDEYVIFDTKQQRIRYLVEFRLDGDRINDKKEFRMDESCEIDETIEIFEDIVLTDIQNITNPLDDVKPGLISTSDKPVTLKSVHIKAKLMDLSSRVIVLQEYYNSSTDSSIEAKYVFPLDDMAAVCGFEAFINGKHIIGEVKEKETARKEYKKAISEGHGAYLMDRDEETPDVFTVSVGNLPPGARVLIKITYVAELQVEDEKISFRLSGSVAPWKHDLAIQDKTQDELDTVAVKEGDMSIQIAVQMPFDIVTIDSPTNSVRMKKTASMAVVELCPGESIKEGFQLLVGLTEIHVPRMWVETMPDNSTEDRACMLTFFPEFTANEEDQTEIIFMLDLSNSMSGNGLEDAKKILRLTLHHMSENTQFNIISFGSSYEELFPRCRKKTSAVLDTACKFIQAAVANKGNTEIYEPLHSLFLLAPTTGIQNIFLFSDGHINNDDTVLNSALLHAKNTRIFTFAVSSTSNFHMLRGLARVAGGAYEYFDRKTKSKWEGKIKRQLEKAVQPSLTSVSVEWQQFDDNLPEPVQAPRKITALFNGSRQVVYGFVPNCTLATLKAVVDGQEVSTVVSTPDLNITSGQILHTLTARSIIRDWEDGMLSSEKTDHEIMKKNLKQYIIDLSKRYSIVTQFTSFIAVEKRDEIEKDMEQGRGPDISELVSAEDVDILNQISFPDEQMDFEDMWDQEKKKDEEEDVILPLYDISSSGSDYEYELCGTYDSSSSGSEDEEEESSGTYDDKLGSCLLSVYGMQDLEEDNVIMDSKIACQGLDNDLDINLEIELEETYDEYCPDSEENIISGTTSKGFPRSNWSSDASISDSTIVLDSSLFSGPASRDLPSLSQGSFPFGTQSSAPVSSGTGFGGSLFSGPTLKDSHGLPSGFGTPNISSVFGSVSAMGFGGTQSNILVPEPASSFGFGFGGSNTGPARKGSYLDLGGSQSDISALKPVFGFSGSNTDSSAVAINASYLGGYQGDILVPKPVPGSFQILPEMAETPAHSTENTNIETYKSSSQSISFDGLEGERKKKKKVSLSMDLLLSPTSLSENQPLPPPMIQDQLPTSPPPPPMSANATRQDSPMKKRALPPIPQNSRSRAPPPPPRISIRAHPPPMPIYALGGHQMRSVPPPPGACPPPTRNLGLGGRQMRSVPPPPPPPMQSQGRGGHQMRSVPPPPPTQMQSAPVIIDEQAEFDQPTRAGVQRFMSNRQIRVASELIQQQSMPQPLPVVRDPPPPPPAPPPMQSAPFIIEEQDELYQLPRPRVPIYMHQESNIRASGMMEQQSESLSPPVLRGLPKRGFQCQTANRAAPLPRSPLKETYMALCVQGELDQPTPVVRDLPPPPPAPPPMQSAPFIVKEQDELNQPTRARVQRYMPHPPRVSEWIPLISMGLPKGGLQCQTTYSAAPLPRSPLKETLFQQSSKVIKSSDKIDKVLSVEETGMAVQLEQVLEKRSVCADRNLDDDDIYDDDDIHVYVDAVNLSRRRNRDQKDDNDEQVLERMSVRRRNRDQKLYKRSSLSNKIETKMSDRQKEKPTEVSDVDTFCSFFGEDDDDDNVTKSRSPGDQVKEKHKLATPPSDVREDDISISPPLPTMKARIRRGAVSKEVYEKEDTCTQHVKKLKIPKFLGQGADEFSIPYGQQTPSICKSSYHHEIDINSLITLQSEEGFWTFSDRFDAMVLIDSLLCRSLLIRCGIKSLGEKVTEEILKLLATLIALIAILEEMRICTEQAKRTKLTTEKLLSLSYANKLISLYVHDSSERARFCLAVQKCINVIIDTKNKYPLVPYTLELENSWEQIAFKLLDTRLNILDYAKYFKYNPTCKRTVASRNVKITT